MTESAGRKMCRSNSALCVVDSCDWLGCGECMVWSCEVITQLALLCSYPDVKQPVGKSEIRSAPSGLMDNL